MKRKILSNQYLMVSLITLSVWIVANIANLLLFLVFVLIQQGSTGDLWHGTGLVLVCASVFSLPGIIVFGLVFLFCLNNKSLFRILLVTAFSTSFLSVLFFLLCLDIAVVSQSISVFIIAIIAAVVSVALHRPAITYVSNARKEKLVEYKNLNLET